MSNKVKLPELLAPAGDMSALKSAIASGADAIYFGTDLFNARMRANNFSLDQACEAIALCHAHGVKAFVTLNISLYNRELAQMLKYVSVLYENGVDALIVADIGAMRVIKRYFPSLEIHASTQASAHNLDGVLALEKLGCKRVVVARELDKESISYICNRSEAEIEIFVHGAHCMSASGQCLMSYTMGGRSGNRGECAQPCRLPYKAGTKTAYPLSLKDMSLAAHISEIIDTGASSLKIEGRMKSADYVGGAVEIWRELLDKKQNATRAHMARLEGLFSRQGFSDGYFTSEIDENMLGVRSEENKAQTKDIRVVTKELQKPLLDMYASFIAGEKAYLCVSDGKRKECVYGDIVEEAISQPMSTDALAKNLSKLGTTPYALGKLEIEKSDNIMVRNSALNDLRRRAVKKMLFYTREKTDAEYTPQGAVKEARCLRSALFSKPEQIPENADYFDRIYVYADRYESGCGANGICIPPVVLDKEWEQIEQKMAQARADGLKYALVSNIGQIERAKKHNFVLCADYRFNSFNAECVNYLYSLGFDDVILSPELSIPQARDMAGASIVAYGCLPVMTTHKCVLKDYVGCEKCCGFIADRTGARLFCEGIFGHRNLIYNSVPIYMADRAEELRAFSWHFIFSSEEKSECYDIIEAYKKKSPTLKKIRRIKI